MVVIKKTVCKTHFDNYVIKYHKINIDRNILFPYCTKLFISKQWGNHQDNYSMCH